MSRRLDALMAVTLFAASVGYLASLPYNLGFADESYFLYEAKRIREGEMLYRDVFQYVTPIAPYLMAALYWLFGATMTTARVSTAVLHGVTVVLLYASARTLGVAIPLAAIAALAHVAIAQPAWPFASWHWFSTCVTAVILLVLVRGRWASSRRGTLALGAWCGVLIGIQQQRGVIPTTGVGLIVVLSAVVNGWTGGTRAMSEVIRRTAVFAAGVVLIVVPLLLAFVVGAGAEPVYHALVRFPMENYRDSFQTTWGSISPLSRVYALDTFPRTLRLLPLALLLPLLRGFVDVFRRRNGDEVRRRMTLILFAAACSGSIWYYPDFIHIAFIAGPLFVCAAWSVQWLLDAVPLPSAAHAIAWIIGFVAAGIFAQHLGTLSRTKWARYPYALETAFGRVDFASPWEPFLVDAVRTRLAQSTSKELFCYPALASPYLTTGAKNPTPFQHFHAPVFPPQDTARVIAALEQRRVPYVLASPFGMGKDDPIARLVERDYTIVNIPGLFDMSPSPAFWLFQRKPDHD